MGEPCADGGTVEGEGCPYDEHAPQTEEGAALWAVLQDAVGQLRLAEGAPVGLDMTAVMPMAEAAGVPRGIATRLLPCLEAGLVEGLKQRRERERESGEDG